MPNGFLNFQAKAERIRQVNNPVPHFFGEHCPFWRFIGGNHRLTPLLRVKRQRGFQRFKNQIIDKLPLAGLFLGNRVMVA